MGPAGWFGQAMRSRLFLLLVLLALGLPVRGQAAAADFPRPQALEPRVNFWRQVFVEYSEYQLVLHDAKYPWKVIKVLDFRPLKRSGTPAAAIEQTMRVAEKRERMLADRMFARLHQVRNHPQSLSTDERRLWRLYADQRADNRFLAARGRVRAQRGLREHFIRAVTVSGRYLPHMERIFRDAGVPVELTRLPFVESSFNVEAYSKVGAAGIWQFMPATARLYMRLDEVVDDRRDPLFSSEAAARHLAEDYRVLRAWPLAVTAYNHGRGGLVAGMRRLGTRDLTDLIERYDSPNFGFASKNFYASFLGALDAYRDHRRYLGQVPVDAPLVYSEFVTQHYVSYHALQRISGLPLDKFRILNPAYNPQVIDGKLLVPPRHRIRIPAGTRQVFTARYRTLGPGELAQAQKRYFHEHRVARGESLGSLARRYGVNVREIQAANNLGRNSRIRIGQTLRIPPRGEGRGVPAMLAARLPEKAPATQAAPAAPAGIQHRVTRGQTLEVIARRYSTTVKAIMTANNLKDPRRLRAGQVLVIPSS
jgi:membrane-bound lytic murein transglycosylase D